MYSTGNSSLLAQSKETILEIFQKKDVYWGIENNELKYFLEIYSLNKNTVKLYICIGKPGKGTMCIGVGFKKGQECSH